MKKALLLFACLCLSLTALAQQPFICTTDGAKLVYVTTDAKGNESGRTEMEIIHVTSSGDNYSITQLTSMYIGGTALTEPFETVATVKDGDVFVDFGGGLTVAAEGAGFVLPKHMDVGLQLPKGEVTVEILGIKNKMDITFHEVVAKEDLTVPAGTFECYVVERRYTAKVLGIKTTASTKAWYARGIGVVRTDTFDKKGKLTSSQVLQELILP